MKFTCQKILAIFALSCLLTACETIPNINSTSKALDYTTPTQNLTIVIDTGGILNALNVGAYTEKSTNPTEIAIANTEMLENYLKPLRASLTKNFTNASISTTFFTINSNVDKAAFSRLISTEKQKPILYLAMSAYEVTNFKMDGVTTRSFLGKATWAILSTSPLE